MGLQTKQLSFDDIFNTPPIEAKQPIIEQKAPKTKKQKEITEDGLIKKFEEISRLSRFPIHTVFEDFCKIGAISFHNAYQNLPAMKYYKEQYDTLEAEYLRLTKKYGQEQTHLLAEGLSMLAILMYSSPRDYLGRVFHRLNLNKHYHGQFFTPDHICQLMAEMTLSPNFDEELKRKGYFSIAEPTCGSGAMLIGAYKVLQDRNIANIGDILYIEATDLDPLCVDMAFLQLSILGLKARVMHGNTFSQEIFHTYHTPELQLVNPECR